MKKYGPNIAAKFTFFAEKAFFWYRTQLSSIPEAIIFHLGSRNCVCTISIHIPTHRKKKFCSSTPREVAILNLKSGLIFCRVYILSNFNFFNTFNVLNGLVFLTDLKVTDLKI